MISSEIQTSSVRGHIDALERRPDDSWLLIGWAHDAAEPNKSLEVEVLEGERVIAVGSTGGYREDVKRAGIGDGFCGLAIPLPPDVIARRDEHDLSLRVAGTGVMITARTHVRKSAYLGSVDGLELGVLSGWALNPADPATPVALDIMVDAKLLDRISADQPRDDVAQRYGTALCGFRWVVPPELAGAGPERIAVRIANTSTILSWQKTDAAQVQRAGPPIPGLQELPSTSRDERRYQAFIDTYYRASRLAIEATGADAVVYAGFAAHEFRPVLARNFPRAYTGTLDRVIANPTSRIGATTLFVLHLDVAQFTERCLSSPDDRFFLERIQSGQPTVLIVESPDTSGGLGSLDLYRTRKWCEKIMQEARRQHMEAALHNTVIDFFYGHPGFLLSLSQARSLPAITFGTGSELARAMSQDGVA